MHKKLFLQESRHFLIIDFKDYLGGHTSDVTKDEFAAFIKKATQKGTSEFDELYYFLLSCFQAGDAHKVKQIANIGPWTNFNKKDKTWASFQL